MPFYSILSGVGVNLYTESLTEACRRHKAPHRKPARGFALSTGFGQLSVSGVRSPLGQPSGVGVARLFSHPMLLTAMGITARKYTPLQMPGSAGKGRVPDVYSKCRNTSPNILRPDVATVLRVYLRLRSSVGPNHCRRGEGGLSNNLNPSRGSRTFCLTSRVRVNQ